ncbi:MAG: sigma-70 family RNA polymerase sigma factor [Opitutaceae bacterium]
MLTSPDDSELLRRYAHAGEEEAFAELVRRYLGLVYHAALRQVGGDAPAAEDVALQVFTRLARKAAALQQHRSLAGWLHTTTRFAASEAMRAECRRRAREQEAFIMQELADHGNTSADWERLRPVLDEAIGELNATDREAVLLRFFGGLGFAAIGARLDVAENTARMRVERALDKLRKLRERLARRGVTSTAAALGVVLANHAAVAAPVGMAATVTVTALAGSVAASAGAVTLISLMSTSKIATGATALTLAALVGTTVYHVRANRTAEAALAQAHLEHETQAAAAKNASGASAIAPSRQQTPEQTLATNPPTRAGVEESIIARPAVSESIPAATRSPLEAARLELARRWLEAASGADFLQARIAQGQALAMEA